MLSDPYSEFVKAVRHYGAHADEIVHGAESTSGEIALGLVSHQSYRVRESIYLILNRLIATFGREILTHW